MGCVGVTVSTAAIGITVSSIPNGASGAIIGCVAAGVNYGIGTDPTTAVGIPLPVNTAIDFEDNLDTLQRIKFVRVSGTDGLITFNFFTEQ